MISGDGTAAVIQLLFSPGAYGSLLWRTHGAHTGAEMKGLDGQVTIERAEGVERQSLQLILAGIHIYRGKESDAFFSGGS